LSKPSERSGKTVMAGPGADPEVQIFSQTKYKIMILLKKAGESDLEGLSRKLHISQMAAYKHVKELESRGLLLHKVRRNGVGRPRLVFRPSPLSNGIYPRGYSKFASTAMGFIEEKLGNEGVVGVFNKLENESVEEYARVVGSGSLQQKARRLASARNDEGYMAEIKKLKGGGLEFLEHNCPLAVLTKKYPGACEAERVLLEKVLGAEAGLLARGADGIEPCRFSLKARQ